MTTCFFSALVLVNRILQSGLTIIWFGISYLSVLIVGISLVSLHKALLFS